MLQVNLKARRQERPDAAIGLQPVGPHVGRAQHLRGFLGVGFGQQDRSGIGLAPGGDPGRLMPPPIREQLPQGRGVPELVRPDGMGNRRLGHAGGGDGMVQPHRIGGDRHPQQGRDQIPWHLGQLRGRSAQDQIARDLVQRLAVAAPIKEATPHADHPAIQQRNLKIKLVGIGRQNPSPAGEGAVRQRAPGQAVKVPEAGQRTQHKGIGIQPDHLAVLVQKVGQFQLGQHHMGQMRKVAPDLRRRQRHAQPGFDIGPGKAAKPAARPERKERRLLAGNPS
jgi:hypothetical protein